MNSTTPSAIGRDLYSNQWCTSLWLLNISIQSMKNIIGHTVTAIVMRDRISLYRKRNRVIIMNHIDKTIIMRLKG